MLLIENPEFSTMRGTWNQVLDSLLRRMVNEGHSQGSVTLKLNIDTQFGSVMDYFEMFMQRMILCRKAAEKLGLQFKLIINDQQLI